jgi:thiol:disulfide interchange protein/DsbC/DsbD-like thiol-disulfide interchange protein
MRRCIPGILAVAVMTCVLVAIGMVSTPAESAAAPTARKPSPRVRVELVSPQRGIEPGGSIWVGLRQRIARGWHTYWINPGDSGEPTSITWTLPDGFHADEIAWPRPERIPVGPVMSYGYTNDVVLPVLLHAPSGLKPGTQVTLRAHVSWLVCEKICIPEEARLELSLPVVAGTPPPDPRGAQMIGRARRSVPTSIPWPASVSFASDAITLHVKAPDLGTARIAEVWFYPRQWGLIDHAAPQAVTIAGDGLRLKVARGALTPDPGTAVEGVLVVEERLDQGVASQAFLVRATPERRRDDLAAPALTGVSLPRALVLALAGGLLLNLMPCVLPVLSIKVLALMRHAGGRPSMVRWHGIAYTTGVLVSFALVGGILVALRASGTRIGWGFQLQSPVFVTLLAYVVFVLALSLSGALLIGARVAGLGHRLAERPGYIGSFFTGTLATIAATPCTAPFMGVAMGFALTQPPTTSLLVFQALALGLALPYLALTLVPSWGRRLPRPGPWMERVKQFLAFPLYGTAAWLIWVVSQQAGPQGVAAALTGLVLIAFALWLYQASRSLPALWRRAAGVAAASVMLVSITLGAMIGGLPLSSPVSAPATGGLRWEPFSPTRLAELRAQGAPVFVNFTAAWCITCLVNERVALRSSAVIEAFARQGIVALKADWTNRDAQIADVLGSFGRSGVPLYLLYPATRPGQAGEPVVLPQILSENILIDAIAN